MTKYKIQIKNVKYAPFFVLFFFCFNIRVRHRTLCENIFFDDTDLQKHILCMICIHVIVIIISETTTVVTFVIFNVNERQNFSLLNRWFPSNSNQLKVSQRPENNFEHSCRCFFETLISSYLFHYISE